MSNELLFLALFASSFIVGSILVELWKRKVRREAEADQNIDGYLEQYRQIKRLRLAIIDLGDRPVSDDLEELHHQLAWCLKVEADLDKEIVHVTAQVEQGHPVLEVLNILRGFKKC